MVCGSNIAVHFCTYVQNHGVKPTTPWFYRIKIHGVVGFTFKFCMYYIKCIVMLREVGNFTTEFVDKIFNFAAV